MTYICFFFVLHWFATFLKFGPLPSENPRCAPEQVQGCGIVCVLIVLQVITLTVWVKLFLMVASLYCVPFSLVLFLVLCVPMERVSHMGNKTPFSGIKVSTQLSVLRFALAELSLICSCLGKISSKSCKIVNCVMISVFAVRCV